MSRKAFEYPLERTKYGNTKVELDGIIFDSRKEANRYWELKMLEKAGQISNLQTQVKYELISAKYEECDEVYSRGIRKGQKKQGKCIEQACYYLADFVYEMDGKVIVEDAKGMRTKEYIIKRKLMLDRFGIRVREV